MNITTKWKRLMKKKTELYSKLISKCLNKPAKEQNIFDEISTVVQDLQRAKADK